MEYTIGKRGIFFEIKLQHTILNKMVHYRTLSMHLTDCLHPFLNSQLSHCSLPSFHEILEFSPNSLVRYDRSVRFVGLITLRKIRICHSNKFFQFVQISVLLDKMKIRMKTQFLMSHCADLTSYS